MAKSNTGLIVAAVAGVGVVLALCCCGVGVGIYFVGPAGIGGPAAPGGPFAPDVVGRWEADVISKLVLHLRADGSGTMEIPEAKVVIRITHKLQGNELKIAPAAGQNLGPGERDAVERFEHTRVTRIGNTLRLEALSGPGLGQVAVFQKVG